ncbi:MAG: hypothetical protein IKG47_00390 [Oscillospiraceae bacterium]|nr:hypothetical protein [Clostridiales bacterium]MBR3353803.1 hypothetical protein [Oscillospiraceae bacterium]
MDDIEYFKYMLDILQQIANDVSVIAESLKQEQKDLYSEDIQHVAYDEQQMGYEK